MANGLWLKCTKEKRQWTELGSAVCCPLFPSVSTGYEPKELGAVGEVDAVCC